MADMRPEMSFFLYVSIKTKGRRILSQNFSREGIYVLITRRLREMFGHSFKRSANIFFSRYNLFANFEPHCENKEIRDVCITNLSNKDLQRELLTDTVKPEIAFSSAKNREMGQIS